MPIYEYECEDCGARFEVTHSANAKPLKTCGSHCPEGHKTGKVRKVFHPATIIFKGSGWHIKDYAGSRNGSGKSSKTPKSDESSSAPKETKETVTASKDKD